MSSPDLVNAVRMWVHFDNLAESLNKQVTNARALRSEYETKVLDQLEKSNMKNASLKVNGATLQRATRFKSTDLGWTMLEEQLHEYYKTSGKPDETKQIMAFLQKNRGGKTVEYLKKTTPQLTQNTPPVPAVTAPQPFALQPKK
jgi:hypothetical protein